MAFAVYSFWSIGVFFSAFHYVHSHAFINPDLLFKLMMLTFVLIAFDINQDNTDVLLKMSFEVVDCTKGGATVMGSENERVNAAL